MTASNQEVMPVVRELIETLRRVAGEQKAYRETTVRDLLAAAQWIEDRMQPVETSAVMPICKMSEKCGYYPSCACGHFLSNADKTEPPLRAICNWCGNPLDLPAISCPVRDCHAKGGL